MISRKEAFKLEVLHTGLEERKPKLIGWKVLQDQQDDSNSLLLITYEYENVTVEGMKPMKTRRFAIYQGDKQYAKVSGIVSTKFDKSADDQ